jgi:nucleoside phosphorylase
VLRANPTAHAGGLITAREVAATAEAKAALRSRSGAAAVDMESAAILAVADATGCAALVVRGVSDHAGQALPAELLELLTSDGALGFSNAVALVLSRPRTIPRAIELGRGTRRALRAVARALGPLAA